jgi:hypothetical protein
VLVFPAITIPFPKIGNGTNVQLRQLNSCVLYIYSIHSPRASTSGYGEPLWHGLSANGITRDAKARKINGEPKMTPLRDEDHQRCQPGDSVITVVLAAGDDLLGFFSSEEESSH